MEPEVKAMSDKVRYTPDMNTAVKAYLMAKVVIKTIKPIVHANQQEALKEVFLCDRRTKKRITDISNTWLAFDNENFERYIRLSYKYNKEKGLKTKYEGRQDAWGYCPLLCAESDLRAATRKLIDACSFFTGISSKDAAGNMDVWDQLPETLAGMIINFHPDFKQALS